MSCPCWSCTLSRAVRRFRWLYPRKAWQRIYGALCHALQETEDWDMVRFDAMRGLPTIIDGRRYVPAERRPTDETEGEDTT